mgnify:CR=1 FL=1
MHSDIAGQPFECLGKREKLAHLLLLLFALDRLALWMQRHGWITYRKPPKPKRSSGGGGGGAMAGLLTEFQKIVEPQIEHRIQVMEERNESIGQRLGRGDGIDPPPPTTTSPTTPNTDHKS